MESLLKMIKEASIDCSLNYNDTINTKEPFTCLDFGSSVSPNAYSFVPNIDLSWSRGSNMNKNQ